MDAVCPLLKEQHYLTPVQHCQAFRVGETKDVCGSDPTQFAALRLDTLPPAIPLFSLLLSLAPCLAQPADLWRLGQGPSLLTEYSCAPRPWPTQPPP